MNNALLGLAKKAGLLEIGEDSVTRAVRAHKACVIFTASDASPNAQRRAGQLAAQRRCPHVSLPLTKEELGALVGRRTPGILAMTDAGLAHRYVSQLAQVDPEKYASDAEALRQRAERIAQRRKEMAAHLRNKRTGKRRTKQ
ncbi:MAG TPA: 50S ribosomal protein L7 [Papillibacter sp.]|jgi:ribosomal protein L7Ae-like RNA K-turn-binding protein|nr:50S ribosomal protein L7 [Papillibacter sp.]